MKGDFTRDRFDPANRYSSVRSQQGRVQVDADWNEAIDILAHWDRTTRRDVIGLCGGPQGQDSAGNDLAGFLIEVVDGELRITKGRYYVDGLLVENEADVAITAQSDLPNLPDNALKDVLVGAEEASDGGSYLAYLDVWERHITALEDPAIREVALGGPDTTTRTKVVWQVRLMPAETSEDVALNCASELPLWDEVTAPSSGRLSARAEPGEAETDPCEVPAKAGYRGLENQLYRVEVHRVISANDITIKWSRENGSVVFGWTSQDPLNPSKLTLSSTGRDDVLGLATDDWVELTDDKHELRGESGLLVKVVNVEGNVLTIDPGSETVDKQEFPVNPKVRRWDMPRDAGEIAVDLTLVDNWIALENGVEVKLEPGTYRTSDYWLIPARTATRDIEWPQNEANDPLPQPPHGIQHYYCRLALLSFAGESWERLSDCRNLFPPLTEMIRFFYVSGDGQEAMPGQTLPQPLQVGVANGQWPVAGVQVRFSIIAGNGTLTDGNLTRATLTVQTGANGVAECSWELDATTQSQRVEASLIDAPNSPLRFNAGLSRASAVAYDPRGCPDLAAAGANTVQQAIDALCQRRPQEEPGIGIRRIVTADGGILLNDTPVPVTRLAEGLRIACDAPLSPESGGSGPPVIDNPLQGSVPAKPTCFVTLDIPYPLSSDQIFRWDPREGGIVGFQPLMLGSTVTMRGNEIEWRPTDPTRRWVLNALFQGLSNLRIAVIRAHLTIKGNFIWRGDSGDEPSVYLDGDGFGRPGPNGRVDVRLPSGDGRRGGDFEMWFWLVPGGVIAPDIDVTPTSLAFGNVSVGQSPTQSLTVRNTGNAPLSVNTITSNNPRFSAVAPAVPFTVAPNGQQPVSVRFSPTAAGQQTGVLSIASNDPDAPGVPIQLQGVGVGVPDIAVTPTALDFGSVFRGQSRDLQLAVRNTGSAELRVSGTNITSNPPWFRVVSPAGPFSVAPNDQQTVTVRFSPTAESGLPVTGVLSIASNDPDAPSVPIQLQGVSPIG